MSEKVRQNLKGGSIMKSKKNRLTKRIGVLLVVVALFCATLAFSAFAAETSPVRGDVCYTIGDINEDGNVTSKDAIRLAFLSLTQSDKAWDFDNDGKVDGQDAIYLLYSVNRLFEDLFPSVEKTVHAYGEPTWVLDLDNESAVAIYTCACGQSTVRESAEVTVDKKAATCTENGYVKFTATCEFGGVTDTEAKEEILEAEGHKLTSKLACVDRECTSCDYTVKAGAHNYGEAEVVEATCTEAERNKYTCKDCEFVYVEYVGEAKGHTYVMNEVHVDACNYQSVYECSVCGDELSTDETYQKHEYVVSYAKESTCTETGEKVSTCKLCGHSESEVIAKDPEAHIWDAGVVNGEVTTYTCACGQTRTTINAKTETSATVSQETLKEVGEVEVNNAAIKLDDATLEQLQGEVAISVETVDKEDLSLSEEEKEQIGNNPVYDFSMTSNTTQVSEFDGEVTVTLPYELQEGDDVECIDVWFIGDDGEVEIKKGTYSNGYVTFKTKHFSYYTVTRLTPKQRCDAYGHSLRVGKPVAATCEADGYTLELCVRCGYKNEADKVPALGHNITKVEVAATCETNGSIVETCSNGCGHEKTIVIPKTGHNWESSSFVAPSCAVAGSEEFACTNAGCNETNKVVYDKIAHELEHITVEATCDSKGYIESACKNCDYKVTTDNGAAKGHAYKPNWDWVEKDGALTATLTLTCENDASHTVVKEGVISILKQVAPTCEKDGKIVYEAVASHNQSVYSSEYNVTEVKFGHRESDKVEFHTTKHFNVCTICGTRLNEEEHTYDDGSVVKEATCQEEGEIVYTCACGYAYTEEVPKTGHNVVNGTCAVCGFKTEQCTHEASHREYLEVEASKDFCGAWFEFEVCDCGERRWIWDAGIMCDDGNQDWEYYVTEDGLYLSEVSIDCSVCGTNLAAKEVADVISKEDCDVVFGTRYLFTTKAGDVVVDVTSVEGQPGHRACVYEKETDLAQYGLCDGKFVELRCVCGQNEGWHYTSEKCEWVYEESKDEGEYYSCANCGIRRLESWGETQLSDCQWKYDAKMTFIKDGQNLVSFEREFIETYHRWEEKPELLGETCTDGLHVVLECEDCGITDEYTYTPEACSNSVFYTEETLEVDGICGGYISVYKGTCACGAYEDSSVGLPECSNWRWDSEYEEADDLSSFVTTEIRTCKDCGLKVVDEFAYTATDMKCQFVGTRTTKYYFDEEELATTTEEVWIHRDDRYGKLASFEFLGEDCDDGVIATIECSVCGDKNTEEYYHHRWFDMETYDLADYGFCGGSVIVRGCACGLEGYIERTEGGCDWMHWHHDGETNTNTYKCLDCGAMYEEQYITEMEGCYGTATRRLEYVKGYNVVLAVEQTTNHQDHDMITTFELDVPGGTCSDGYTIYQVCTSCGYQDSWHNEPGEGEHWTNVTERYDLTDYGFCGGFIEKWSCACGEETGTYRDIWSHCNWYHYQYDEATETSWYKCRECDNFRSEKSVELAAEGCVRTMETTYTFYDAQKNKVLETVNKERWEDHDATYTFVLDVPGGTCSDGFLVTETCEACGRQESWHETPSEGDHPTYTMSRYDLAEYGFCGGFAGVRACPCGEQEHIYIDDEMCDWSETQYQGEGWADWCWKCSNKRIQTQGEAVVDGCHVSAYHTMTFTDSDLNEYFTITATETWEEHNYVEEFIMDGDTCSDGYERNWYCANEGCDARGSEYCEPEEGEHWIYTLEGYDLEDYGFCEGYIRVHGCPCGEEKWFDAWLGEFSWVGYDEETGSERYECETCGGSYTYKHISEKLEGCDVQETREYTFYNKAGAEVLKLANVEKKEEHTYECSFELLGETCEDGYYVIRTCKYCGYSWRENEIHNGHSDWCTEIVTGEELGLCGGVLRHIECPCGMREFWDNALHCSFSWIDGGDSYWTVQCEICGIVRETKDTQSQMDACHNVSSHVSEFYRDGVKVFEYSYDNIEEHHTNIHKLTLMNPGTTCAEGVYIHSTCINCGLESDWTTYEHSSHLVEQIFVGKEGTCGTTIGRYSCACGENGWYDRMTDGCSYNYIDDNTSKCEGCGTTREFLYAEGPKDENCNYEVYRTWKYYDASGNLTYEFTETERYVGHEYEVEDYVMNDPSDCEAGYQETMVCKGCGDMYINENWYHSTKMKYDYHLADYGGCEGSRIWYEECYCGQIGSYSSDIYSYCDIYSSYNNYQDELGRAHFVEVRRCDKCDLMLTIDEMYVRDPATCIVTRTYDVTIAVGNTAVGAFTYERTESSHDYETTGSLLPGSVDCEDGVMITNTCRDCGDTYAYEEYFHHEYTIESYDIAELGAECGGEVKVIGCACGRNKSITREATLCDWDYDYRCENLILGDELTNQYGVDGETSGYRWYNNYKCAVSDPTQCGFIIRVCEYSIWDKANCVARRYVTWQLGYDEATGTCAKEITIATGETYAYHDYETTYEDIANGTVTGSKTSGVCKTCNSSFEEIYTYDSSTQTTHEESRATNSANNGKNQLRERIYEYRYFMDSYFTLLDCEKVIYADDSVYWRNEESVVDFSNYNCEVLRKYSNSYGESNEWVEEHHINHWERIYDYTCSQYAYEVGSCKICNEYVGESQWGPYGHNWYVDDSTGMYYCGTCGLESTTGADGAIVMEDLTAEYGNGTDYVVGYHKFDQDMYVDYTYYVSLVLPTGEDVFIDVAFEELDRKADGIQAITFDKAEVTAAAAEAGYTTYDVRFAFVPVGADGSFDYAITLTN